MRMVVDSDFQYLVQVVDQTEAFVARHIDDEELAYAVVLLTSEAVTNAIEHGNALDATKRVFIEIEVGRRLLQVSVQDEGTGFERTQVKDPLDDQNLLRDGGRGIFLIEEMADEVRYEMGGRKVIIVFHLNTESS